MNTDAVHSVAYGPQQKFDEKSGPERRNPLEIAPGTHRLQTPLGDRFVCLLLLVGVEATLLIHTGISSTPREHLAPYLESKNFPLDSIRCVLTSDADFDHTGGNHSAHKLLPNALFLYHRLDQPWVKDLELMINERYCELQADHNIGEGEEPRKFVRSTSQHVPMNRTLLGSESLRLGACWHVDILHTPGHLSVHDANKKTLIIADATLYNAVLSIDGKPTFPPTYRYLETYLSTIGSLQAVKARTLLTSQYPVHARGKVSEFLGESRAFANRLDTALREEPKRATAPRTMKQLVDTLSIKIGDWPEAVNKYLSAPLCGHLEHLVKQGLVDSAHLEERVTYRWKI